MLTALQGTDVALVDGLVDGSGTGGGVSGDRRDKGNSRDEEDSKFGEHCEFLKSVSLREQLRVCLVDWRI